MRCSGRGFSGNGGERGRLRRSGEPGSFREKGVDMIDYENTRDEQLVRLARGGDSDAEEFLIRKYKDVARTKAHLYFIAGADREDLMQEGMIGIFKAIRGYDESREASFRTFAELCINRQILTAIKAAARLKHAPLNDSLSIDMPLAGDDQDSEKTLGDTLPAGDYDNPEKLFIFKENMDYIEGRGSEIFSEMELRVWNEYLKGKSYAEIAEIVGKSTKAVDNAIQRTKRKVEVYLNS